MLPGVQENVREWTFTLPNELPFWGVGVPVDSQIFKERLQGSKPIWLKSYIIGKLLEHRCQNGFAWPIWTLNTQVIAKERSGVKLAIWLLPTESQELPQFPCVQVVWNIPLKSFQQGLQLFFNLHLNQRFSRKVMGPQSHKSPSCGNFGTPT